MEPFIEAVGNPESPGSGIGPRAAVGQAIRAFRDGGLVVVEPDAAAGEGGAVVLAACKVAEQQVAFLLREIRGLIIAGLCPARADQLDLHALGNDTSQRSYTEMVDVRDGTTTGISARERAATLRALANLDLSADAFVRPGHVIPARSATDGVFSRRCVIEASVDLARMAGLPPVTVIVDALSAKGQVLDAGRTRALAVSHGLPIVAPRDVWLVRLSGEHHVSLGEPREIHFDGVAACAVPFSTPALPGEHVAVVVGIHQPPSGGIVAHVSCAAHDPLMSLVCDCRLRLERDLSALTSTGGGLLVYLRAERGGSARAEGALEIVAGAVARQVADLLGSSDGRAKVSLSLAAGNCSQPLGPSTRRAVSDERSSAAVERVEAVR